LYFVQSQHTRIECNHSYNHADPKARAMTVTITISLSEDNIVRLCLWTSCVSLPLTDTPHDSGDMVRGQHTTNLQNINACQKQRNILTNIQDYMFHGFNTPSYTTTTEFSARSVIKFEHFIASVLRGQAKGQRSSSLHQWSL
jgi:hypothetical protein